MKIEIRDRYTNDVIFSHDCENNTIKLTVLLAIDNKISLANANLSDANLEGANLSYANLIGANLSYANLSYADLKGANLRGADLIGANLIGANLRGTNLNLADLEGANLIGANLRGANLEGANLSDANLIGANLIDAIGNMREICSMQIETYKIAFTKDILQIGCKHYSHQEWFDFRDDIIDAMDRSALLFWEKYKEFIFKAIELKFGAIYE